MQWCQAAERRAFILEDTDMWRYSKLILLWPLPEIAIRYISEVWKCKWFSERGDDAGSVLQKVKEEVSGQTGTGQTAECLSLFFVCQSYMFFPAFLWSATMGQNSYTANFLWYTKHHWLCLRLLHGLIWPSISVISQHRKRERERRGRVRQGSVEQNRWCWIKTYSFILIFTLNQKK